MSKELDIHGDFSGVQCSQVIDMIGEEPKYNSLVLYMFETREQEDSEERYLELKIS